MRRDLQTHRQYLSIPLHRTTCLINPIKDQLLLQNQLPKRITPIPTVISNRLVGVDLDEDISDDQCPAKDPACDDAEEGFIGGEAKLRASEEGIGQKVAVGTIPSLAGFMKDSPHHSLEQDDIHHLPEHQPRVKLLGHRIPSVAFMSHLGLQLLLPPRRPRILDLAALPLGTLKPPALPQLSYNPPSFTLFPQHPAQARIVCCTPKGKVRPEEDGSCPGREVNECPDLECKAEEGENGEVGGKDCVRKGMDERMRRRDFEDCGDVSVASSEKKVTHLSHPVSFHRLASRRTP